MIELRRPMLLVICIALAGIATLAACWSSVDRQEAEPAAQSTTGGPVLDPPTPPPALAANLSPSVSWTIGTATSAIDGVPNKGPLTFTWTFDRPVAHGVYLDGTPWVKWQERLKLILVSPRKKIEDLPNWKGFPWTPA